MDSINWTPNLIALKLQTELESAEQERKRGSTEAKQAIATAKVIYGEAKEAYNADMISIKSRYTQAVNSARRAAELRTMALTETYAED